jgi:sulfatase maturation enzyme AslB (radical SAM superfamily)
MQKQKHSKPVKIFQLFDSFGNDEKAQIFNCCSKESDNKPMVEFSGNCEANLQEAIISEMANGAFLVEYVHIWIRLLNLPKECRCPN